MQRCVCIQKWINNNNQLIDSCSVICWRKQKSPWTFRSNVKSLSVGWGEHPAEWLYGSPEIAPIKLPSKIASFFFFFSQTFQKYLKHFISFISSHRFAFFNWLQQNSRKKKKTTFGCLFINYYTISLYFLVNFMLKINNQHYCGIGWVVV